MPSHCLTFHNGELNIKRYWEPVFEADESVSLDDWVERIDNAMHDSVEHHKISDVEVGSFLSSGVDSSYVAATFNGDKTFTVGFDYENIMKLTTQKHFPKKLKLTIIPSWFPVKNTGLRFQKSSTIWTSLWQTRLQLPSTL